MIIPDFEIRQWAQNGGLTPFNTECINPASIDLRWSGNVKIAMENGWHDIGNVPEKIFYPGALYLLDTLEYIKIPPCWAGELMLKSSLGRQGLEHLHCISGNTLIDIPRDLSLFPLGIQVKELEGKEFFVYSFDIENMKFRLNKATAVKARRNVSVVKVCYKWVAGGSYHQSSIVCTPDHKFLLLDGNWLKADELEGKRLRPFGRTITDRYSIVTDDPLNKKMHYEHRVIAEQLNGNLIDHVHHKDRNKINNSPENLEVLKEYDHLFLHSSGKNNNFFGKTHTIETRKKISVLHKGRKLSKETCQRMGNSRLGEKNPRYIPLSLYEIVDAYKETNNVEKAAYKLSVSVDTLLNKIKQFGFSGTVDFRNSIRSQENHKVISVEDFGTEDTYDLIVERDHNFVANGVVIHNSGWFDPGFEGTGTLEIKNMAPWPIALKKGQKIVQMAFHELKALPEKSYQVTGRYNGQRGPTEAKENKK